MSEILYGDLNLIIWWPREFFCVREVVIDDPFVCKVELSLINVVIWLIYTKAFHLEELKYGGVIT
jgi:hypothetical protein